MNRLLLSLLSTFLVIIGAQGQSWQPMATIGPAGAGVNLLITDGSVLVHHFDAADWWKLTPDINGA